MTEILITHGILEGVTVYKHLEEDVKFIHLLNKPIFSVYSAQLLKDLENLNSMIFET